MTKAIPIIQKHMTKSPHAIGIDQPLIVAHALMKKHEIRHLPVLDGGALVGVITDRDLSLIETLREVDPKHVTVEDAMSSSVYAIKPETPLEEVVITMAERKYGCAVVMHHNQVVGIFTTVDACRVLAELLHTRVAA